MKKRRTQSILLLNPTNSFFRTAACPQRRRAKKNRRMIGRFLESLQPRLCMTAPTAILDMPAYTQPVNDVNVIFSETMDVATVTNSSNYDFEPDGVDVSIDSIQYNAVTNTATLHFNEPLSQGDHELFVDAGAILAADGHAYRSDPDSAGGMTNSLFGKLPIRRGNGDLSFTTIDNLNAGRNLGIIKDGNLNGDGDVDFVVQQLGRDAIYCLSE